VALVEQDYLRRVLLREREGSGGIAPSLIEQTARFCLDHGYHVVVEGILGSQLYAPSLRGLLAAHCGPRFCFYLDVTFAETVRRHATRPQSAEFTPDDMRAWYQPRDLLGVDGERIIPEHSTLDETVDYIATLTGLTPTASSG